MALCLKSADRCRELLIYSTGLVLSFFFFFTWYFSQLSCILFITSFAVFVYGTDSCESDLIKKKTEQCLNLFHQWKLYRSNQTLGVRVTVGDASPCVLSLSSSLSELWTFQWRLWSEGIPEHSDLGVSIFLSSCFCPCCFLPALLIHVLQLFHLVTGSVVVLHCLGFLMRRPI